MTRPQKAKLLLATGATTVLAAPGILRWLILARPVADAKVLFAYGWWVCGLIGFLGILLEVGLLASFTVGNVIGRLLAGLSALALFAYAMLIPHVFVDRTEVRPGISREYRWNSDKFRSDETIHVRP